MNKIENLRDLLIEQGREMYDCTQQEINELPNIEKHIASTSLKTIVKKQIQTAQQQHARLKKTLTDLQASTAGSKCKTTETILKKSNNLITNSKTAGVRDAAIINSLQELGHRKIAGLGAISAYAREIGHVATAEDLHKSLEEEKQLDHELTNLAQSDINKKAGAALTY